MATKRKSIGKKGMTPFKPTKEQRESVWSMAAVGITHEQIASVTKNPRTGEAISTITLAKHFHEELTEGKIQALEKVHAALYRRAINDDHKDATTAAIWITKAQSKWRSEERVEHTVVDKREVMGDAMDLLRDSVPQSESDGAKADAKYRKRANKPRKK